MSTGIWAAASGAVGQGYALDVAANNVANAQTPGFKAERAVFHQQLARASDSDASRTLRYSMTRSASPNLAAGATQRTGRALDVAITDPTALFVVRTAQGERYTRAGSLVLTPDGQLQTPQGDAYVGADHRALRVNGAQSVSITPQGTLVVDGQETSQRLLLVSFPNTSGLEKDGHLLLRARPDAGQARISDTTLQPEVLEMSNASAVTGMTDLVTTTRQFEMLTRVIEAFSAADRRAATDIIGKT